MAWEARKAEEGEGEAGLHPWCGEGKFAVPIPTQRKGQTQAEKEGEEEKRTKEVKEGRKGGREGGRVKREESEEQLRDS